MLIVPPRSLVYWWTNHDPAVSKIAHCGQARTPFDDFGGWWWGTIRKSAEQRPGITADRRLRLLCYTGKIIGYKLLRRR